MNTGKGRSRRHPSEFEFSKRDPKWNVLGIMNKDDMMSVRTRHGKGKKTGVGGPARDSPILFIEVNKPQIRCTVDESDSTVYALYITAQKYDLPEGYI